MRKWCWSLFEGLNCRELRRLDNGNEGDRSLERTSKERIMGIKMPSQVITGKVKEFQKVQVNFVRSGLKLFQQLTKLNLWNLPIASYRPSCSSINLCFRNYSAVQLFLRRERTLPTFFLPCGDALTAEGNKIEKEHWRTVGKKKGNLIAPLLNVTDQILQCELIWVHWNNWN